MKITASQLYAYLSLPAPEIVDDRLLSIHIDTRVMRKENSSIYIAIKGERFDGHDYCAEAIQKGAVVCIANFDYLEKGDEVNFIFVEDTALALQKIATGIRQNSSIPWVGITGSTGKTSTRNFIGQLLNEQGPVLETIKNNNNQIGVPLTVLDLKEEHQFALVEAGTNHFGEILPLAEILKPDIGLITNIGPTHLEFLESVEGVAKEKADLLKLIPSEGVAVLNQDSLMFDYLKSQCVCRVISFGINKGDFSIEKKVEFQQGCVVTVKGIEYLLPFRESHYISNFLAALVVALELKISIKDIQQSCQKLKSASNRLEIVIKEPIQLIDDSYNANLDSMLAAFEVLKNSTSSNRKILILGDMKELGSQSKYFHERLMLKLNEFNFNVVLLSGPEMSKVRHMAVADEVYFFETKEELISFCLSSEDDGGIAEGDAILIKASKSMNFGEIVLAIKNQWKEDN